MRASLACNGLTAPVTVLALFASLSTEAKHAPVSSTNGTSLKPFRAIVLHLGNVSWLHQARHRLWPTFPRPRFPPSWAVADAVVCDGSQHRIDQRLAVLWPRRFELRGKRHQDLLGPFEAHPPWLGAVLAGSHGHDRAQQVVRQQVRPYLLRNHLGRLAPQDFHLHR